MQKQKPPALAAEPSAISDIPELLTPLEAAKILRTTVGVLAVWRSESRLDLPYIKVGRRVFYDRCDLICFLQSHKVRRVEPDSIALGVKQ